MWWGIWSYFYNVEAFPKVALTFANITEKEILVEDAHALFIIKNSV